jgi:hypothetical protein
VITPRAIIVTAASDSKTYDGTTTSTAVPIITGGLVTGDVPDFTQVFDSPDVGFRTLTASGIVSDGNGGANYSYTFETAAGTINQLGVTVTANSGQSKVYGTADPTLTYQVTSGSLVSGDSFSGSLSRAAGENVGGYTILQGTLTAGGNYTLDFVQATFTVTPRAITVTAATASKAYDGTNASTAVPTITTGTLAFADVANFSETFDTKNVGTSKTLIPAGSVSDGNGGNNYTVTFVDNATGVITARALTVTAMPDSKTYDGTTNSSVVPVISTGTLAPGDTADFTESFATRNVGTDESLTPAGSVNDGNGGNNYAVTFVNNTNGVITARALTVTAATASKGYDGTTGSSSVPTISSGSLAPGDVADFTESFDTKNVGTGKTLTPAGSVDDGNGGNNYAVTFANNTAGVITARAVTVTADAKIKVIGQPDPALTFQVTSGSLIPGDSFSGGLSRVSGEAAGSYGILQGTLALDSNYALSFAGANLTILPLSGTQTTILGSSASRSVYGQLVSISAIVAPTSGAVTPAGNVVFMDGSTVLGSSPLDGSVAVFSTTALKVATHSIAAIYVGDGFFALSQSPVFTQIVSPASTTTTLSVEPSSNRRGVILDAEVSPVSPAGGLPTGFVSFAVKGRPFRSVRLVNGQAKLEVSNKAALRKWIDAGFVTSAISYKPSLSKAVFVTSKLLKAQPAAQRVMLVESPKIEGQKTKAHSVLPNGATGDDLRVAQVAPKKTLGRFRFFRA